jgi:hypothetical protein
MTRPTHHLLARSHPASPFLTVWLARRDGPARSALLWGEVLPAALDALAGATGLPVVREEWAADPGPAMTPPGCADLAKQQTLFGEEGS